MGGNLFDGQVVESPTNMVNVDGHEFGCGLRTVTGVGRVFIPDLGDETVLQEVARAGYDEYWGMELEMMGSALSNLNLKVSVRQNPTLDEIYNDVGRGNIWVVNFTLPAFEISDEAGYSGVFCGERGHNGFIKGIENPRVKGDATKILLADPSIGEGDSLVGYWTVNAAAFVSRLWKDFKYLGKPDDGKVLGVSTDGEVIYPVEWQERRGLVVTGGNK